jgi:hypothetical protein
MWIIIWRQTRWIISCSHNYLMHSEIIIQNHSTLAVLSSQIDVLCANPMKIKIPKRVMHAADGWFSSSSWVFT